MSEIGPHVQAAAGTASSIPALGYEFRHSDLLDRALTHSSFAHDLAHESTGGPLPTGAPPPADYEVFEFLGDAVLGFLVAEEILKRHPGMSEGDMSRLRASLVSARSLAERSDALGLGGHLRLGRGERAGGAEVKRSILSDAFESVLGAIFLDGGIRAARAFVRRQFAREIRSAMPSRPQPGDYKTRLQEIVQAKGDHPPVYRLVAEDGPPHKRTFMIEVVLPDGLAFQGTGMSKKQAEQSAAEYALAFLAPQP